MSRTNVKEVDQIPVDGIRFNENAFNHSKTYTREDIDSLKFSIVSGSQASMYDTAISLGRQVSSIFTKLKALGLIKTHGHGERVAASLTHFQRLPLCILQKGIDKFLSDKVGYVVEVAKEIPKEDPWLTLSGKSVGDGGVVTANTIQGFASDNSKWLNTVDHYIATGGIRVPMQKENLIQSKTGESKMTNRRTVSIVMYDDSKGIKDEVANVYSTELVTSEVSNERIIQQLLFNESVDINQAVDDHNEYRIEQVDLDILQRTGNQVMLRPLEFKDLRWEIK